MSRREHFRELCKCNYPNCTTCNLYTCSVCNCSEGELPTECPGVIVPYLQRMQIYKGALDFVGGEWRDLTAPEPRSNNLYQVSMRMEVIAAEQIAREKADRKAICDAEHDYEGFRRRVMARFEKNKELPLFTTDSGDLYATFLANLPAHREHYACHACRRFFEVYGGLATVRDDGTLQPVFWNEDDAPAFFVDAVRALRRKIANAEVTGVFRSSETVWGTPVTGEWTHFAVVPPPSLVHTGRLLTANQAAAAKLEDYKFVCRSLAQYKKPMVDQVVALLEAEKLPGGDKVVGPAKFLQELHAARENLRGRARDNVTWLGVATAPAGRIHSSLVRTLLDDLASGKDFNEVTQAFLSKTHPLKYQRAQVAPTAGNIARAEEIVAKLGIAPSLERRFARLEEVEALWKPRPAEAPKSSAGVFAHLIPKGSVPSIPPLSIPATTMTWEKFRRTVLPTAEEIQYQAPSRGSYAALVTAVHQDAPPILEWDTPERRNPVSWYFWHQGSHATQWGLVGGRYYPVSAVCLRPSQWGPNPDAYPHQGKGVMFIIDEARETRQCGSAIFPSTLRSELHEVRSTIERFSATAELKGMEQGNACGVMLHDQSWGGQIRVRTGQTWMEYRLDRWD